MSAVVVTVAVASVWKWTRWCWTQAVISPKALESIGSRSALPRSRARIGPGLIRLDREKLCLVVPVSEIVFEGLCAIIPENGEKTGSEPNGQLISSSRCWTDVPTTLSTESAWDRTVTGRRVTYGIVGLPG